MMSSKPTTAGAVLRILAMLVVVLFATPTLSHGGPGYRGDGDGDGDGDDDYPWLYGPPTTTGTGSSSDATSDATSAAGRNGYTGFDTAQATHYRTVHGILAAVAFVAMFPLGATFVRVLPGKAALVMHAVAQILALLLFVCAAALGIWLLVNVQPGGTSLLSLPGHQAHPILGILILILVFAMPVLGFLHHSAYKRHLRRTGVSYVHIWLGRCLLILGIVNGGLGLQQAGASHDVKVGYAIVAALVGCIWLFFAVLGEMRRRREQKQQQRGMNVGPAGGGGGGGGRGGAAPYLAGAAAGGVMGGGMMFHGRGGSDVASSIIETERRGMQERLSSDAGTVRVSEETDRPVHRTKSARHDSVSEISSRV